MRSGEKEYGLATRQISILSNIYGQIYKTVLVEPRPKNRDELIARVQNTWENISTQRLKDLVESFPNRLQQAKANNGGHTDY